MSTEDAPATTLADEVRRAIAETCAHHFCRAAETAALYAETREEWRAVPVDIALEAGASLPPSLDAAAVASCLMAEDDADTAARTLAAVHGRSVAEWRAIQRNDRDDAA